MITGEEGSHSNQMLDMESMVLENWEASVSRQVGGDFSPRINLSRHTNWLSDENLDKRTQI
jgi:hypothetical protein